MRHLVISIWLTSTALAFSVLAREPSHMAQQAPRAFIHDQRSGGSEDLQARLADSEERNRRLQARLDVLANDKWLAEAKSLGVIHVLSTFGFTDGQQQRIAVAIVKHAREHNLDPLLVVAIIECESSFNPYAKSGPGAMGLMQLMPATARWMAQQRGFQLGRAHNLYDAELNIELGTAYLATLLRQFESLDPALIAYNSGPHAARAHMRAGRPTLAHRYCRRVLRALRSLKAGAAHIADRASSQPTES